MSASRDPHDPSRKRHLEALEALFSPKAPSAPPVAPPSTRTLAKIVATTPLVADPAKERLVGRLLAAEGSRAVSLATSALEAAGFAVPADFDASLRMLEHPDEARVTGAIERLARIVADGKAHRKAVLDARLRRIESDAEEASTRDAASALRRALVQS
jgi:hypothetical protein